MSLDDQRKKFTDLYTQESDPLFRFCMLRVSGREQALDLAQEAFTRLWKALVEGKPINNQKAFLFVIARNLIIDWYRKIKATSLEGLSDEDEEFDFPDESGFGKIELSAEASRVVAMIDQLEPQYKEVIYLRYVEDLPPKEIANVLNIKANVISVRITRGMKSLRKLMNAED